MPDPIGPTASHRLRYAMQLRGVASGAELARLTHQNEVTVRSHVNGTRDVSKRTAEGYSRALAIDPAWLLYGHGPAPSSDGTRSRGDYAPSSSSDEGIDEREWREKTARRACAVGARAPGERVSTLRPRRSRVCSVSAGADAHVPTIVAAPQELHFNERIQELTAGHVIKLPETSGLFAPEREPGHFFVLAANAIQRFPPRA